ncbi:ATP-binding cassette domain-containing protein [Virgibacillus sp.]|uniref:ATP-binding cassette domain-containing protein n=1 Tax=Virgibacillus sp. TaxID=1872700 RepID=UPI0025DC9963|nr:ATP-binding cassette domain-containing protein [Virgibacillus sp.]
MKAIEVKNLKKEIGTLRIEGLNFTVPQGRIVGLVGENGAGKTTTIKLMMDVMEKDEGEVLFFGKTLNKAIKEEIGVVYDEINFYEKINAIKIDKVLKGIFQSWDSDNIFNCLIALNSIKVNC